MVRELFHRQHYLLYLMLKLLHGLIPKKTIFLVLKAVRHAVYNNYHHLEMFANVLLKFTTNAPCANAIIKDCGKYRMLVINIILK